MKNLFLSLLVSMVFVSVGCSHYKKSGCGSNCECSKEQKSDCGGCKEKKKEECKECADSEKKSEKKK